MPEPVEGPRIEPVLEPDPELDEACVAEYEPCGHPDERPEQAPPQEPAADSCSCGGDGDSPLRTPVDLPAGLDVKAAGPKVVLHFHLSDQALRRDAGQALVRPGQGEPLMLAELREWLAGTGCRIVVQPVIDPAATAPTDAYEIPDRIRAAVRYRDIADVSPWGTSTSAGLDLDHTRPYRAQGPPGQTRPGNLGPFVRAVHRAKTVGAKHVRQPEPGVFVYRSRHGHITLVTNRGTISLGRNTFADAVWRLADGGPSSRAEGRLMDMLGLPAGVQVLRAA